MRQTLEYKQKMSVPYHIHADADLMGIIYGK